jgi:imidazolonepropionase-like amidohydrolase
MSDPELKTNQNALRFPHAMMVAGLVCALLVATSAASAQQTYIKAGRLLDVVSGNITNNAGILIEDGKILETGAGMKPPKGATIIDLGEMTVLPGLIDSHTHVCLTPEDSSRNPVLYKTNPFRALGALSGALDNLLAGFTTLRDLDNEGADMADIAVRDAINHGLYMGPRLFVSGWALSITAGHMNLTGLRPSVDRKLEQLAIMADSKEAMVAAIRDQKKTGVDFIKIYATGTMRHIDRKTLEPLPQLSVEEVELMVKEAARWRMDVAAHAYGGDGAYNAVAGGVRSIEHGMFLDDRTLDLMVARGTFWSPTMKVYFPEESDSVEEKAFRLRVTEKHKDSFQRAMKKGVKIAFGTDAGSLPHGEGRQELNLMAEYGMSALDIIRSATVVGAELLHMEDELGRIAPGYMADIIAVKGRPEEDISALDDVSFVMIGGQVAKADN